MSGKVLMEVCASDKPASEMLTMAVVMEKTQPFRNRQHLNRHYFDWSRPTFKHRSAMVAFHLPTEKPPENES